MSFIIFVSVTWITLDSFKKNLDESFASRLILAAESQNKRIKVFIKHNKELLQLVTSRTQLRLTLQEHLQHPTQQNVDDMNRTLQDAKQSIPDFRTISISNSSGEIIASTDKEQIGLTTSNPDLYATLESKVHHSSLQYEITRDQENRLFMHLHGSLEVEGKNIGNIHVRIDANELIQITQDYTGLGESGETLLAQRTPNGDAQFLTPLRFDPDAALKRTIAADRRDIPIILALLGQSGFQGGVVDYREVPVLAVTSYLPSVGWGILTKIDQEEVYTTYNVLKTTLMELFIVFLLTATTGAYFLSRSITHPIEYLTNIIQRIKKGERQLRAKQMRFDRETHLLSTAFDDLTHELVEMFYSAPNGMLVLNEKGIIQRCNTQVEKVFDYNEIELIGKEVEIILPECLKDEKTSHQNFYLSNLNLSEINQNFQGRRKNGKQFPVEISLAPFQSDNQTFILCNVIDITERRELEQKLDNHLIHLEETVEERTRELKIVNQFKSEFLAKMSHEIRTPMNGIMGMVYLILQKELPNNLRQKINKIDKASKLLLHIINDILDYSKVEAGKLTIEHSPFNLEEILDNIACISKTIAKSKDIELIIHLDHQTPLNLIGDSIRVNQILTNLINNAIKFTEQGFVIFSISGTRLRNNEVQLSFNVKDTGIGMDNDILENLFKPFEQADASITRKYGGTGLGLAIVRQLVDLMGGTIHAESELEKGSTFKVLLPFEESKETINYRPYEEVSFEKLHLMIVEDNPIILENLDEIISGFGCNTSLARTGEQAIALSKQANIAGKPFDIILMDWRLPDTDGLSTAEKIKNKSKQQIPIIIMETAYGMELLCQQKIKHIADMLITKPVTPSSMFDALVYFVDSKYNYVETGHTKVSGTLLQGMQLLLVEDNDINQEVAKSMLENVGAQVLIAGNGVQALEILMQYSSSINAVIMDMQMPVMDGLEATRKIRQYPQWKDLPIIATTANATEKDKQKCLVAGMNAYISKPINPKLLYEILSPWWQVAVPTKLVNDNDELVNHVPDLLIATVENLNIKKALDILSQDKQLLQRVLDKLINQSEDSVTKLTEFVADGDFQSAKDTVHALKGTSSHLAAERILGISITLEQLLSDNANHDEQIINQQIDELANATKALSEEIPTIKEILAYENQSDLDEKANPGGKIENMLKNLKEALKNHEYSANELSEQLFKIVDNTKIKKQFKNVFFAVQDLDYEKALTELDNMQWK